METCLQGKNFQINEDMSQSEYKITLLPEKTSVQINCKVILTDLRSLFCTVTMKEWDQYKKSKIMIRVIISINYRKFTSLVQVWMSLGVLSW